VVLHKVRIQFYGIEQWDRTGWRHNHTVTPPKNITLISKNLQVLYHPRPFSRYLWSRNWPMKCLIFFVEKLQNWITKEGLDMDITWFFFRGGFVCAFVFQFSDLSTVIAILFYCSSSKSELPRLDDNGSLYNLKALGALCLGSLLKYLKR
jgi:hypothetical protein